MQSRYGVTAEAESRRYGVTTANYTRWALGPGYEGDERSRLTGSKSGIDVLIRRDYTGETTGLYIGLDRNSTPLLVRRGLRAEIVNFPFTYPLLGPVFDVEYRTSV